MVDLPTFLVVVYLMSGVVYQDMTQAPSKQACEAVVKDIKTMLPKVVGSVPDAYVATCVTLKPFTKAS